MTRRCSGRRPEHRPTMVRAALTHHAPADQGSIVVSAPDLSVLEVDMCASINKPNHFTSSYYTNLLVVRRGQQWLMKVTFSRPLHQNENIQVEFLIGES